MVKKKNSRFLKTKEIIDEELIKKTEDALKEVKKLFFL